MYLGCIPGGSKTTKNVRIQNDLTNAVWDPQSPNQYASDASINRELSDGERGRDFKQFLSDHDRYNVASQSNPPRTSWTKTSKAGLEFQVKNHRTVHFIITGLNLADIAGKTNYGAKGNITSAEVRWLYRHRNTTDVQNHVRFWDNLREYTHAEFLGRGEWASYNPTSVYGADWNDTNGIRKMVSIASSHP
jgi:insecticidal toxin complex protein TccC